MNYLNIKNKVIIYIFWQSKSLLQKHLNFNGHSMPTYVSLCRTEPPHARPRKFDRRRELLKIFIFLTGSISWSNVLFSQKLYLQQQFVTVCTHFMIIPNSWQKLRQTNLNFDPFHPLEKKPMSNTLNNYFHRETEASAASFAEEGHPPFQTEVEHNRSTPSTMAKRLYHNASERDRRKKINTLYSTLRSLLPKADQAVLILSFFHF